MSDIKYEIIKKIGVLSKSGAGGIACSLMLILVADTLMARPLVLNLERAG
jgi:hypothetical protein